ncbi:hypothetical protein [uncultured Deefgea sp.]|uniref:hypothetical protein n=1 Tax=uncultured Deefgea sp. TaxID=1304914 RepID=UPI00261A3265|nr:hypothetical protein [uncultured Deefgea sp.]
MQLIGCLHCSDTPVVTLPKLDAKSTIFYDSLSENSVWFSNDEPAANLQPVTTWLRRHFPSAIRGDFQGKHGQHALRGPALAELNKIAHGLVPEPFAEYLAKSKTPNSRTAASTNYCPYQR